MIRWPFPEPGRYTVFALCVLATLGLTIALWATGGGSTLLLAMTAVAVGLTCLASAT